MAQLVNEVGLDETAVSMHLQIPRLVYRQQPVVCVYHFIIQVHIRQRRFGQVAGNHVALANDLIWGGGTAVAGHLSRFNPRLPDFPRLVGEAAC